MAKLLTETPNKSLNAYNLVVCGHIQDVMFYNYNPEDLVALKAKVLPKQMPLTNLLAKQS